MTRRLTCAALLLTTATLTAQDDAVLRVDDIPDQIIRVHTRIRHTTVIQLPPHENILDFVVGDSEYWHLTGAANLAFLKPISEGVNTNVALVCESGRIYSFLVSERPEGEPHLVVRIEAGDGQPAAGHVPAFVARDQIAAYQQMADHARATAAAAQDDAAEQIAEAHQQASVTVDAFRSAYPTQLQFPYRLEDKATKWPFLVESMWHDGTFTYLRSHAQETPALYEIKDGKPAVIAYDVGADGLYIARRLLGPGWLQIGRERAGWKVDLEDLEP